MQPSATGEAAATFDEVREVLTAYMVGMLGQQVTLVTNSTHYASQETLSTGIRITLPDKVSNHASHQMNLDRYWMCAAMQGAGILYTEDTIHHKDLQHFEKTLGCPSFLHIGTVGVYAIDDYFKNVFGYLSTFVHEIYASVETARLRYRLGQDFPGLDAKIEAVISDTLHNGTNSSDLPLDGFLRGSPRTQRVLCDADGASWSSDMLSRLWTALFSTENCEELISSNKLVRSLYTKMADVLFVEQPGMRQSLHATAIALRQLLPKPVMERIRSCDPPREYNRSHKDETPNSAGTSVYLGLGIPQPVTYDTHQVQKHSPGTFVYDEWSHSDRRYIKSRALVKEVSCFPSEHTLGGQHSSKPKFKIHPSLIKALKNDLETLLPEGRARDFGQRKGTIHLPSLARYRARKHAGLQPDPNICYQWMETKRDVAVAYLIDASRSTALYPNQRALSANMMTIDMMRQGLLHLLRASEELGDDYGVYVYQSSVAIGDHHNTHVVTVKDMSAQQPYAITQDRLLSIPPYGDNRDGAALRHILYQKLVNHAARTKLLVHLNDGVPEHGLMYPGTEYGGQYALEDTKKALDEAKACGIIPLSFSYAIGGDKETLRKLWGDSITFVESPKELSKALSRALLMHTAE